MEQGSLNSIVGPMASGKSREVLSKLHQQEYNRTLNLPHKKVLLAKPLTDERTQEVHTRDKNIKNVQPHKKFSHADELDSFVRESSSDHMVLVDELQFDVEGDIAKTLDELATDGYEIYAAFLPTSFTGWAFSEQAKDILAYSDSVSNLFAICAVCEGEGAVKTMRLDKRGKPVAFDSKLVELGFNYQPVCRKDHKIPGRPGLKFSKQLKDNGVGKLLVVSGPPSSGKTDVLRGYLNKLSGSATHYAHPPLVNKLVTSGEAVLIDNYHKLNSGVENYARLLDEMATRGYFVVVSGDPLDSKNKPYASMREILPLADNVQVEYAYEKINGVRLPATKSRVVGGSLVPVSRHTFKSA